MLHYISRIEVEEFEDIKSGFSVSLVSVTLLAILSQKLAMFDQFCLMEFSAF